MAGITTFERHVERYEKWFESHGAAYESEVHGVGQGSFVALRAEVMT